MELLWVLLLLVNLGLVVLLVFRKPPVSLDQNKVQEKLQAELTQNREELQRNLREIRLELTQSLDRLVETIAKKAKEDREEQRTTLKDFQEAFSKNVKEFNELQKQKFEGMRLKQDELMKTTELRLEKMRETVDEKIA